MEITLTLSPELSQAVAEAGDAPVRVEDPETRTSYVVIREDVYRRLREAALEDDWTWDGSEEGALPDEDAGHRPPVRRPGVAGIPWEVAMGRSPENGERTDPLAHIAQELATYKARLPELVAHEGQYVLIKGDQVIGFFDDFVSAEREGRRRFGLDSIFVKKIAAVEPVIYLPNVVL